MEANPPVVPAVPALQFPNDYYGHKDCPTEWFWHIGTLEAADGRKFGFEINAANFSIFGFTQIEITDVKNQVNYQKVNVSARRQKTGHKPILLNRGT
ncbi:hypothetical protein [Flavobacterium sp. 3HN19-14]|uniref:hypothetical protein n=1 Tax=Flavobacterium sp. 3HN19-14 TaxID=3448133 RepID=UPI003EE3DD86